MVLKDSHTKSINKDSIGNNTLGKNLILNLNHQTSFPRNYQSHCKIPGSTKAMQFNLLGSESKPKNKRKVSSKTKGRGTHKKSYSRKSNVMPKQSLSGNKQPKFEEFSSPYKLGKKGEKTSNSDNYLLRFMQFI